MFEINTERLRIVALDLENFDLFVNNYGQMQRNLGTNVVKEEMEEWLQKVFGPVVKRAQEDPENILWYTSWQIISKEKNEVVGSIGFKNLPDEQKKVEIGYGVSEIYWNKGYMTEVVGAIIKWAIYDGKVSSVIAETDKNNLPSQRVLEKNGMRIFNETEEFFWWTT